MITEELRAFIKDQARKRFMKYVTIHTTSSESSDEQPSTGGQWDLARILKDELKQLGLSKVEVDKHCYVYASLPATEGVKSAAITFCSHLDTSPSENGDGVNPKIHENYDGEVITFPDNPELILSPEECPELRMFVDDTIITASGTTLLGADDKAGIAEIMAALAAFQKFSFLKHPQLRIVFTPDEEIGRGPDHITMSKLGKYGYTIDGGKIGEFEDECFDAFEINIVFHGINVHPGEAKNRMVNAVAIASRFLSTLPENEMPENREKREGFYHLARLTGDQNRADARLIIRDFEKEKNLERLDYIHALKKGFETRYHGLKIEVAVKEQYKNMKKVLKDYPEVVNRAEKAIEMAGLTPQRIGIRGGTDGSRLSFMGMPTPNIFTGGMLFHSKKEWIAESALQKACEVVINLCSIYANQNV